MIYNKIDSETCEVTLTFTYFYLLLLTSQVAGFWEKTALLFRKNMRYDIYCQMDRVKNVSEVSKVTKMGMPSRKYFFSRFWAVF